MNYKSPIRLLNNIDEAKNTRPHQIADIGYFNQVCLNPFETYFQITNSENDIVFNGNYKAEVVTCCDVILLDITDFVFLEEQTDEFGIRQIAFEIVQIGQDFYGQNVLLKFTNTLNLVSWYSNPILITENSNTTFLQYRGVSYFGGFDYFKFNKIQSIRVNAFFRNNVNEITSSEYTNEVGHKVASVPTMTEYENYIFQMCDNFAYRFMNNILTHPIIYINSYRITNVNLLKDVEPLGLSNIGDSEFKVAMNYKDKITNSLQIAEPLQLILTEPLGTYTLDTLPNGLRLDFNHDVNISIGNIQIYRISPTVELTGTYNVNDLLLLGNKVILNSGFPILTVGNYVVRIDADMFTSPFGNLQYTEFEFNIIDGGYDADFYEPINYLT